jgi:hypothetical protein
MNRAPHRIVLHHISRDLLPALSEVATNEKTTRESSHIQVVRVRARAGVRVRASDRVRG